MTELSYSLSFFSNLGLSHPFTVYNYIFFLFKFLVTFCPVNHFPGYQYGFYWKALQEVL